MTEMPPSTGNGSDDVFAPPPDDELDDPWHDQIVEVSDSFGAPDVQAVVAFVLGIVSMLGFGLLSGAPYAFQSFSAGDSFRTRNILAALIGAGFALVPVILGWRASARVLATDPRWIAALARAAVILGLLSLVLRLVLAVLAAAAQDPVGRFPSV